jgi:hypothetical protein
MEDKKLLYEELDGLFEQIVSGERCIIFDNVVFVLKYPTKITVDSCKRIQTICSLKYKELAPTSEEIPSFISTSSDQNLDISFLEKEKIKLERVIASQGVKENSQSLEFYDNKLQIVKKQLQETKLINERSSDLDRFALDRKIRDFVYYRLLRNCVYYYKSSNNIELFFNNDIRRYSHWVSRLLNEFLIFYIGPGDTILRQLARHPKVSSLWKISSNIGTGFFNSNACDYTPIQIKLCFWLGYYSDVFKNLGSPDSDKIVEDDKLFDEWVKSKVKDMKNKKSDTSSNKSGGKSGNVAQHKIIFKEPTHASSKRATTKG